MKIIFVDNSLAGFVNFRIDVAEHFYRKGYEVVLCYPIETIKDVLEKQIPEGIRTAPVHCQPSGTNIVSDVKYAKALFRLYKKERPDLVFNYTIKPNIYGTLMAKILGIRVVDMVAGLGYAFTKKGISGVAVQTLYKFALRKADKVIALNEGNRQLLVDNGFVSSKRMVLFNGGEGVNLEKYPYAKNEFNCPVRFLMVARVLYDKGYTEFVEAAALVKKRFPDITAELLGPIDESSPMAVPRNVLERDVADGKIIYLGVTDDVPSYVRRDSVVVVVVSSYHEGLNRSLMEACAMARPVITTNIPGCRETVEDGRNGFLVPVKDSEALADAMIRFINLTREEKMMMAEASYQKACSFFGLDSVLKSYEAIIGELVVRR